jgi:hypothetical protein
LDHDRGLAAPDQQPSIATPSKGRLRAAAWVVAALVLLFTAMNFHVLALDFTTTPPPSVSYSAYGASDQQPLHPEHAQRGLAGYFTADPYGTVALPPFDSFTLASVTKLQVPFWNPLTLTGHPFINEFFWGIFYPPKLLLAVLPQSYWDLYSAAHILLAGLFVAWLSWLYTRDRLACAFAGASVFGTGFLLMYFPTHTIIVVVPWGVLLLGGIERLCRLSSSVIGFLAVVVGVAGLGVAGHPPVAIDFALGAMVFLALRLVIDPESRRALAPFVLAGACGVLLALPNMFGFLSVMLSGQETAGGGDRPNYYSLLKLLQFWLPYAAGPINEVAATLPPAYGPPVPGYAWGPPLMLFASVAGLQAAIRQRRRGVLALAGSGLVLVMLGLGWLPVHLLHSGAFNRLNMNYVWIYPGMVLCVLAGLGAQALANEPPRRLAITVTAPFMILSMVIAAYYYRQLTAGAPRPLPRDLIDTIRRGVLPGAMWAVGAPAMVMGAAWATGPRPAARAFVVPALLTLGLGISVVGSYPSANRTGQTVLPLAAFALFCVTAPLLVILVQRTTRRRLVVAAAGLLAVIGGASAWAALAYPGLPPRYHKVRAPAYLARLQQAGPNWRSYGIDGAVASDNLVRFGLSVVNNENTMLPADEAAFFQTYVDPNQPPQLFSGASHNPGGAAASFMSHRRIWDYLAVRYVLAPAAALASDPQQAALFSAGAIDLNEAQPVLIPVDGQAPPLKVDLPCAGGSFSVVRIKLSTYLRRNAGRIRATLTDASGHVLGQAYQSGPQIRDNEFHDFSFPEVCQGGAGQVSLALDHLEAKPGEDVAAWRSASMSVLALPQRRASTNALGLVAVETDSATGMSIFENPTAQPRAYIAQRLESAQDWKSAMARFVAQSDLRQAAFVEPGAPACAAASPGQAAGSASVDRISPNEVHIVADTRQGGPLVLVDTFDADWKATVNGVASPLFRVNGLFRGLCLPGRGHFEVAMRYEPAYWRWVVWTPMVGALLAAWVMILRLRGRRAASAPS